MKQLTLLDGFHLSLGHGARRLRLRQALRPEEALVPIELNLLDVMVDLDPGMVNWETGLFLKLA